MYDRVTVGQKKKKYIYIYTCRIVIRHCYSSNLRTVDILCIAGAAADATSLSDILNHRSRSKNDLDY